MKGKQTHEKVIFANGVFDVLHVGHVRLLEAAKALGGRLVVGINSDRVVKLLKGTERPIYSAQERKEILEALRCVDEVIIFDELTTREIVRRLYPDVVVKGGEFVPEEVRRIDGIPADIEVRVFPLSINPEKQGEKYSTTGTIEKIERVGGSRESAPKKL